MSGPSPPPGVRCSFCFTHQDDVADIVVNYVTGAKVAICDACIDLSYEIVTKARERWVVGVTA